MPALALIGCSSGPSSQQVSAPSSPQRSASSKPSAGLPALPPAGSGRGGYYMDDGPGDAPPEGLLDIPDAEPRIEPYSKRGNRPYVVFGKSYTPITDERPFKQRGKGSWYGKKFHGQKTSSGELYDMYKMTAAHPTLPIPSYVRVTSLANGRQVIVRVNDRGPFHSGRIIDLSYTAALKLGYLAQGSAELEVERLLPEEIARMAAEKAQAPAQVAQDTQQAPSATVFSVDLANTTVRQDSLSLPASTLQDNTSLSSGSAITASATPIPGFYLQLGAYAQASNAETARARLMQRAGSTLPPAEVVESGTYFRLYSGPFATRAEAAAAAASLQEEGHFRPLVVQR